jgi:hypothetical protein
VNGGTAWDPALIILERIQERHQSVVKGKQVVQKCGEVCVA